MFVCQVALDDSLQCYEYLHHLELPEDKHSVKGMGKIFPNPDESTFFNGFEVPFGEPVIDNEIDSLFLFNEYVVYNVDRVKIEYVIKMRIIIRRTYCF